MPRPWNTIPIRDCCEPLQPIPTGIHRWDPHPYKALGAPYPKAKCPFQLRQSVLLRLVRAQATLQQLQPSLGLLIFDAWRPLAVQKFMVELSLNTPGAKRDEVEALWAPPSDDPQCAPPHSTGSAVDLCLCDAAGSPLEMGGEIDALGSIAEPDHFAEAAQGSPEALWHQRRELLATAMGRGGFSRHPAEWWHFSWGDQLWAWSCGVAVARYGRLPED